jgi:hypothetical protein
MTGRFAPKPQPEDSQEADSELISEDFRFPLGVLPESAEA